MTYPALHGPEHRDVGWPAAAPNRPELQGRHTLAPARAYWPAGHRVPSAEPEGQNDPAGQGKGEALVLPTGQ